MQLPRPAFGPLGGQDGVGAARHRRAGHHANRFTRGGDALEREAGHRLTDDGQMHAVVWARAFGAVGRDRVSIHRGAIEARHVDVGYDRGREDASGGASQRDVFSLRAAAVARRAMPERRQPCDVSRSRAFARRIDASTPMLLPGDFNERLQGVGELAEVAGADQRRGERIGTVLVQKRGPRGAQQQLQELDRVLFVRALRSSG